MLNFIKLITLVIIFSIGINNIFASGNIRFNISPIKYTLSGEPGETLIKTAKLSNYTSETINIITGKSDFVANGNGGKPDFIRKSELVNPDQILSEWITIDIDEFEIAPNEIKEITFRIDIPENGTPGGHYGAVFFKNENNTTNGVGNNIALNIDYGVLILLNVEGEVVSEIEVEEPIIKKTSAGGHYTSGLVKDNCPLGDMTKSRYDGKCIDPIKEIINSIKGDKDTEENEEDGIDLISGEDLEEGKDNSDEGEFKIEFEIPINNVGNTHVKPTGKIILSEIDDKGNKTEIKNIGRKIILNEKGAKIGDQIVNNLPINDKEGYVLPGSDRVYKIEWKGFPYKDYDENGNPDIKYWDPSTYYTRKNIKDAGFLMFWERVNERIKTKKIEAIVDLSYIDNEGNVIEFPSAQEFEISYKEKVVENNPYIIVLLAIFGSFIFFIWIILILRKKKCIECKRRIDRNMKICPYCKTKQKKSKISKEEAIISKKTVVKNKNKEEKSKKELKAIEENKRIIAEMKAKSEKNKAKIENIKLDSEKKKIEKEKKKIEKIAKKLKKEKKELKKLNKKSKK